MKNLRPTCVYSQPMASKCQPPSPEYWANCCQYVDIVALLGRVNRPIHKFKRTRISGGQWKRVFGLRQIAGNVKTDCATRGNEARDLCLLIPRGKPSWTCSMFNFSHLDHNRSQRPHSPFLISSFLFLIPNATRVAVCWAPQEPNLLRTPAPLVSDSACCRSGSLLPFSPCHDLLSFSRQSVAVISNGSLLPWSHFHVGCASLNVQTTHVAHIVVLFTSTHPLSALWTFQIHHPTISRWMIQFKCLFLIDNPIL